ncbi:MAG TPA: carboxypeptidase regulatory-like domain-containing protein [Thermoanaerobaculia bacterium]|nr:carboxypeptidase regulatory-like domain-containing protein [Thermoanaerobaculia bacterium]
MHARFAGFVIALCLLAVPASAAITGTVMNGDGAAIAGARVTIRGYESPDARRARLLSDTPEAVPLAATQTDAKGAFTLESPKNPVVGLFVSANGYSPVSTRVERDEDAGAIVLAKAQSRRGVITSGGKPVPDATVAIHYGSYEYVTKTDAEGRYEAPDPKRATALVVLHPDFAIDEKVSFMPAATERDLTRTLSTGTKVTGRVVAADGQTPVAGATLTIDGWPAGKSGEDGTFTIARAPSRWSSLIARKEGLLAQLPYAKTGAYTLRLQKAATISGRITDSKSKVPVAGAVVRTAVSRMTRMEGLTAETDAKGAYSVVVPSGSYMVLAFHPAYAPTDGDVSIAPGQQVTRDFAVTQMARVSGSVVDEEKRPVAAALIAAEEASDPTERMMMRMMRTVNDQVFSGPDGRFSIRVAPDAPLYMNAAKRGFPPAKSDQFRVASGDRKTGLVLTIPSGIGVSGRVTDGDGNPLSGIAVVAEPAEEGRSGMFFRSVMVGGPQGEDEAVRTGSDGSFSIRLKEGTYDFNFRGEGYAPKTVRGQSVTLSAPATVNTTLVPASEITGRVVRGGTGVEGVNINAFATGTSTSAVTAQDGSFTLSGLSAGSLRVMLRKEDDFIQEMRNLTAPSRDVVIELAGGGRVTGRVVDKASGKALTSFQAGISASRGGGGMMMMAPPQLRDFNSEDGSFTLENVPAGAMSLVATAPGYASSRLNVTVEEGKTLGDVELALDAGVRLTGRVTGPNGAPLADVSVRVQPSPTGAFSMRGAESSAVTDTDGEYSLEALPAGEETIAFTHASYLTSRKQVTLKGRETKLDVQLSTGERVSGVVVTEAGAPVADARVEAFGAGMRGGNARTNANGVFEIESLQPGRYRFTAAKTGVGEGSVDDVDLSSNQQVRITMRAGATIYGRIIGLTPEELALASVTARSGRSYVEGNPDPSGSYRLEGAPTGTVTVTAELQSRDVMSNRTSQRQTVEVAPGGSQNVDLTFRTDITIRGRVLRNGKPLPSATVMFVPKRTGQAQTFASSSTNEQGQYTLNGVEEGEYTVEVIDMQRFSPYSTTYTVRGSDTFDIDFSTSSLRGTVVDAATSEPVPNAGIQVNPAIPSDSFRMPRGASTDAQGTFILESVPPGTYVVTTSKDSYGSDTREVMVGDRGEELQVKLSRADDVILKLVDGRDGRAINGQIWVYDAQGRIVYDTMRMFRGIADTDAGQLSLPLAPGSYTASVSANNYASVNIVLQSPSTPRVLALTPGGTLLLRSKHSQHRQIRLIDANGIPYQRYNNPLPSRDLVPQPGTTQIPNIAPGTYTVQLLDGMSVVDTVQVRVEEGGVAEGEI